MTFNFSEAAVDVTLMVFAACWEAHIEQKEVIITVFDDGTKELVEYMLDDVSERFPSATLVVCNKESIH
tara:strand:+ start:1792 stop:1998 length:207 start_codon:yes stop_codon:yes gene_type:complete